MGQTTGLVLEEDCRLGGHWEHTGCAARFTFMACQRLWRDGFLRNESGFAGAKEIGMCILHAALIRRIFSKKAEHRISNSCV